MRLTLRVNGSSHVLDTDGTTPLLYILSDDLALRGPKFGCGLGQCGSCTVLVDGRATRSCMTPVGAVRGWEITTLEGLGTADRPHPIQRAFIEEQAAQCGFCLSGVILTAKALLDEHPKASDAEIREALSTVLCRCFTHARMFRAIAQPDGGRRAAGAEPRAGRSRDVGRSQDHFDRLGDLRHADDGRGDAIDRDGADRPAGRAGGWGRRNRDHARDRCGRQRRVRRHRSPAPAGPLHARTPGLAKRRSRSWPLRSATPCSTPQEPGSGRSPSRPNASRRRCPRDADRVCALAAFPCRTKVTPPVRCDTRRRGLAGDSSVR